MARPTRRYTAGQIRTDLALDPVTAEDYQQLIAEARAAIEQARAALGDQPPSVSISHVISASPLGQSVKPTCFDPQ